MTGMIGWFGFTYTLLDEFVCVSCSRSDLISVDGSVVVLAQKSPVMSKSHYFMYI